MQPKPRVPPFRALPDLLQLVEEKQKLDEIAAAKAKKEGAEQEASEDYQEEKKAEVVVDKKYDVLSHYDFPTFMDKTGTKHIVNFDNQDITLYEIF